MWSYHYLVVVLVTILASALQGSSFHTHKVVLGKSTTRRKSTTVSVASRISKDPSNVSANDLRAIEVTDVNGQKVPLGSAMGRGTSVVVFLRHLGCTWCWSYVYQWKLVQQQLSDAGIEGPVFVSIGDKDRLNTFLQKNPEIPPDKFFVDGYDFAAYKDAGFGRFDEKPKEIIDNVKPKPAQFGGIRGWWTFLTSFIPLAPVTPDMKFPESLTPEGLFWVGGTFVIKDDEIVYRWDDRISGDHPEATEIVEIAMNSVSK